jgi:ABC-type polysaccharide/polyol phosphate export permease
LGAVGLASWAWHDWGVTSLREYRDSRELLTNLTLREVRGKYKRTVLGHGWSLLSPIASLAIFSLVFGLLLRVDPPDGDPSGLDLFVLWLAAGLLPWTFFAGALQSGMGSLAANAGLVTKVYFPREVLVTSVVLSFVATFGIEMTVLVVALLLAGANPLPWLPLVVVLVGLLALFALGLSLLLSVANTLFRDTSYLMTIVLQFWFYLTPVIYPERLVDQAIGAGGLEIVGVDVPVDTLYGLNPMVRFLSCFRALLYDNRMPSLVDWAGVLLPTASVLVVGIVVFRRFAPRLAEEL